TIFACGMTGSGKTHTMNGTPTDPGVVPNAADFLFDALPRLRASVRRAELYVSTFEIYDDKIVDLCSPAHIKRSAVGEKDAASLLLLREDAVRTALALYRDPAKWAFSIRPVDRRRSTGETKLNSASSRSHLVVQFLLLQQQYPSAPTTSSQQPPPLTRYSKITLVDLAGSENNKHTGNAGKRMTESAAINGSLFHLSRVIDALAEKQRGVENVHVPYSHSKLTAALKDALGGSAQSLMIATVSPLVRFTEETRRTLDFVVKSRTIVNAATTNDI
ncbi:P-loop containing nucleoside triphosphate hydrolase protein, partial [Blastocladiella britannica]